MSFSFEQVFPLRPPLPLPEGVAENNLFEWLKHICVEDAPKQEMLNYCMHDFIRFVYTFGLTREALQNITNATNTIPSTPLQCLELGANPYFTTMLIKQFIPCELTLANYFGEFAVKKATQSVNFLEYQPINQEQAQASKMTFDYYHFNIENTRFPFENASFDIVLFCEIIEHLLMNPAQVLREIRRVLKPNGQLILTTPNVARLENIARLLSGANIYDPYSGYGPYGRHNREYNRHELHLLLTYLGFNIERMFTADVHHNNTDTFFDLSSLYKQLQFRKDDFGQYIFVRAISNGIDTGKKPSWLYRSYAANELD